jgi:anti-sigma regulatory factor (Ser/Thr protein kinase)
MIGASDKPISLRQWVIQHIGSRTLATDAAREFKISRQTVNRELRKLTAEGLIKPSGHTRGRHYQIVQLHTLSETVDVTADLKEDSIWRQKVAPLLANVPANVQSICQFGFTEMLNNVIEHSGSPRAGINVNVTASTVMLVVGDEGVGVFNKIRDAYKLEDLHQAVFELSKGKLTTDPESHTGEGIFFTSRVFDLFNIYSGNLILISVPQGGDWLLDVEDRPQFHGTNVMMNISVFSNRTLKSVFDRFAAGDEDYGFSRTKIPLNLAKFGTEQLLSRSQAKRVLTRVNRFKEVLLDFEQVEMIGQGFADEIFRVFKRAHPEVNLSVINANSEVSAMIKHAQSADELVEPFLPMRGLNPPADKKNSEPDPSGSDGSDWSAEVF